MEKIKKILNNTTDSNNDKINWTKAWSDKYPILKKYQNEVDIPKYSNQIRTMLQEIQEEYKYNKEDAMLVLKDILYHEYKSSKK